MTNVVDSMIMEQTVREFETGATRDVDTNKFDYDGYLSPLVIQRFAAYMHKHQTMSDGSVRGSDNWKQGIPLDSYMKSGWRHFMGWWLDHHGYQGQEGVDEALCGLLFNVMGYLHEQLLMENYDGKELLKLPAFLEEGRYQDTKNPEELT